ncbi:phosphonate metabolism protein/1,5-bisphosphokinase (PRPP-forming) PhnN [Terrihabitans sp. B22-R8]|uniref:phosphonate metabolism protein/1,5-bisphosphokinase (PRPP-forming) PhnN n=1 Tax=Terrihabitans sp. B22-R8 TaxID=3425128 RepID=UPI00403C434B
MSDPDRSAGGFILVVGPSGAGKDSLIDLAREALAGDGRFVFPRRIVTRPSSEAEDHDTLGEADFAAAEARGAFALCWRAHGLAYAVPGEARRAAGDGRIVVCNVSRRVVERARVDLPNVLVVEITAPVEVLAERLARRGRAEDGDLAERLARSRAVPVEADARVVNDRTLAEASRAFLDILVQHAKRLPIPS